LKILLLNLMSEMPENSLTSEIDNLSEKIESLHLNSTVAEINSIGQQIKEFK